MSFDLSSSTARRQVFLWDCRAGDFQHRRNPHSQDGDVEPRGERVQSSVWSTTSEGSPNQGAGPRYLPTPMKLSSLTAEQLALILECCAGDLQHLQNPYGGRGGEAGPSSWELRRSRQSSTSTEGSSEERSKPLGMLSLSAAHLAFLFDRCVAEDLHARHRGQDGDIEPRQSSAPSLNREFCLQNYFLHTALVTANSFSIYWKH
jgi:hypothetical protein